MPSRSSAGSPDNFASSSAAPIIACSLTVAIFIVDAFTPLDIAIAVMYGAVILLASSVWPRTNILRLTALCLTLTLFAYVWGHHDDLFGPGFGRCLVSLSAISIIALLALKEQASKKALMQREEALRQADRRKNEFLAMLAHELRNPLAPISAAANLLTISSPGKEIIREVGDILSRQTEHLTGLVNELIDVSRVTRGVVSLKRNKVSMRLIITTAVEQMSPLLRERQHQLDMRLPDEDIFVYGDFQRLVQVMANILGNAIKYTPPKGYISISMSSTDTQVCIEFIDTGIGIPPSLLPYVFDLFTQAEPESDRTHAGLGIGLALVKSLTELHNGHVSCKSEGIGKGSRFQVTLPKLDQSSASIDGFPSPAHLPRTGETMRILVVDDNANAARMLSLYLQALGHSCLVENSFHKGLERAQAEIPDICMLDIGLPEFDGNELARRLRSDPRTKEIFLIAVTGYDQDKDKEKAMAAGFDHYLVKPIDTIMLGALIGRATDPCNSQEDGSLSMDRI